MPFRPYNYRLQTFDKEVKLSLEGCKTQDMWFIYQTKIRKLYTKNTGSTTQLIKSPNLLTTLIMIQQMIRTQQ